MVILFGLMARYAALSNIYAADIYATITTGLFVPLQPVNLAVTVGDSSVDLSWSSPFSNGGSAIFDYGIEYKLTTDGVWTTVADGVSADTFGTVTGLSNDNSYDFRVYAINIIGEGPKSSTAQATPGSPAQVLVMSLSDVTIPSIAALVRITNEGAAPYEYQYTWCVTDSDSNVCGGGNDITHATAAKLIQSGENWDTSLSATIPTIGNYWFHVSVAFGSDVSYASQSFTTVNETSSSGGGSSSSGGGGGAKACVGADLNRDKKVNLTDFSILLMFYNTPAPFKNLCVDINKDDKVNVADFSIMLTQWGKKPVPFKL